MTHQIAGGHSPSRRVVKLLERAKPFAHLAAEIRWRRVEEHLVRVKVRDRVRVRVRVRVRARTPD